MILKMTKTDVKEVIETIKEINPLFKDIDLAELLETTNMDILPKYNLISENDLTTIRKVKIEKLPYTKYIEKVEKELTFMIISDNGIKYSLSCDSIALRRSILSCAIKITKAKDIESIDLSKIVGILLGIKREKFTAKGFTQSPFKFFVLD